MSRGGDKIFKNWIKRWGVVFHEGLKNFFRRRAFPERDRFADVFLVGVFVRVGDRFLWGEYGFRDAYNLQNDWIASDYIGIDQGPILLMIENYRTGLIWRYMRKNPFIIDGLRRAGFTGGWLDSTLNDVNDKYEIETRDFELGQNFPNPFNSNTLIPFTIAEDSYVRINVYNIISQKVDTIFKADLPRGRYVISLNSEALSSGVYLYQMYCVGKQTKHIFSSMRKMIVLK